MLLVTFSGLDGCGKTAHVARTAFYLAEQGWRVRTLATARISAGGVLSRLSETGKRGHSSSRADADRSEGCPASERTCRPSEDERIERSRRAYGPFRRTTGRWRARALLCARQFLYPLDCLVLLASIRVLSLAGYTAVVCDRYIYDKIVNLPQSNGVTARLMRWIAPRPDFAFLIDVPPEVARARREEHDAEYYNMSYSAYRRLCGVRQDLRRIPGTTIDETQRRVRSFLASVAARPASRTAPQAW